MLDKPIAPIMEPGLIFFFAVIAVFLALAIGLVWLTWRLTRKIRSTWIRSLLRACVVAVAITPTIVPDSSLHGAMPMPAAFAVLTGVIDYGSRQSAIAIRYGSIPLVVSVCIIWLVSVAWTSFFARRRAKSDAPKA
jgi:hypothetical protein